jgi:hypothetical protein
MEPGAVAVSNVWRQYGTRALEFLQKAATEIAMRFVKDQLKGEQEKGQQFKEMPELEVTTVFAAPPDPSIVDALMADKPPVLGPVLWCDQPFRYMFEEFNITLPKLTMIPPRLPTLTDLTPFHVPLPDLMSQTQAPIAKATTSQAPAPITETPLRAPLPTPSWLQVLPPILITQSPLDSIPKEATDSQMIDHLFLAGMVIISAGLIYLDRKRMREHKHAIRCLEEFTVRWAQAMGGEQ